MTTFVLQRNRIGYFRHYPLLLLFYLVGIIFVSIFYLEVISGYINNVNLLSIIIPFLALFLAIIIYPILDKYLKIPKSFIKKYNRVLLLRMDYRMITTKFFDVVFSIIKSIF